LKTALIASWQPRPGRSGGPGHFSPGLPQIPA
jgi:hypothetical protein